VRAAPAVPCALLLGRTHTSIQVQRRQSGLPCAMGYGLFRALPGDRAFLPPSSLRNLFLRNLTPASGRQDHTASPSATAAFVMRRHRVHRIPPRVRDDREPPLSSGETGRACRDDLPDGLSGIFFTAGLDRLSVICPSGRLVAVRLGRFRLRARRSRTVGRDRRRVARTRDPLTSS
jgi:hypothetical protein